MTTNLMRRWRAGTMRGTRSALWLRVRPRREERSAKPGGLSKESYPERDPPIEQRTKIRTVARITRLSPRLKVHCRACDSGVVRKTVDLLMTRRCRICQLTVCSDRPRENP